MDHRKNLNVKVKRPQPGQKDPMAKDFTFTIQDPVTGLAWCYICVEVKDRGRRKLISLGIVDTEEIKNADVVYICTEETCGAVMTKRDELLPMSDNELLLMPNVAGRCPKCGKAFCIEIEKKDLSTFPERTAIKEMEDGRESAPAS